MEKSFAYEKEVLARYGLSATIIDVRGDLRIKIFEENKEITQWMGSSDFAAWVQGFIYAMGRRKP